MASRSLARVLLARWYITVGGLLLSLIMASFAYTLVPLQYVSKTTAVLVPPRGGTGTNPMLNFSSGVNMAALIITQSLNSSDVVAGAGLTRGEESYSVTNEGVSSANNTGTDRPFITVTATSLVPSRSVSIANQILLMAQQQLEDRQNSLHVSKRNSMQIQTVVDPSPPTVVLAALLKAVGAVFALGLGGTVLVASIYDRKAMRRVPGIDPSVVKVAATWADVDSGYADAGGGHASHERATNGHRAAEIGSDGQLSIWRPSS